MRTLITPIQTLLIFAFNLACSAGDFAPDFLAGASFSITLTNYDGNPVPPGYQITLTFDSSSYKQTGFSTQSGTYSYIKLDTIHGICYTQKLVPPDPDGGTNLFTFQSSTKGVVVHTYPSSSGFHTQSGTFQLTWISPPNITTLTPLADGIVGIAYSQQFVATGGTPPYTWSIASGNLPEGLTLSTGGTISGTPCAVRNSSFSVQVTDNNGLSSAKVFALTISSGTPNPLFFANSTHVELLPDPTSGPAIKITFAPSTGCTLAEVAQALGYDHFNWLQVAVEYPRSFFTWGLTTPFIDPPPGGYPNDFADNLPFYWDEGSNPKFAPDRILNYWTEAGSLRFLDAPKNPLMLPGEKMRFVTMLVGVRADGTYTPFHTLTWSSTWSGTDGGISTRNPVVPGDLTGSTGGITEVQTNVTLEELPSNVLRLLVNRGASDVPFLDIARQGTTVVVSWPTNILSFVLQRSTNPASAAWSDLPTSANTLSVDAQTPAQYFRLIKR